MVETPLERLSLLESRLESLEAEDGVPPIAVAILSSSIEDLRVDLEEDQWFADESSVRHQSHTAERDIERLEEIIDFLESDPDVPDQAKQLFDQLCERVLGDQPFETVFYEDPEGDLLGFETHFHDHDDSLCIFLRFGAPETCLRYPFASLLAHEASHLHPAFAGPRTRHRMSDRHRRERMQEAEIACDIGGIALLGPAYSEGFSHLDDHIEDPLRPTDPRHPSLAARAIGMREIGIPLWDDHQDVMETHLQPFPTSVDSLLETDERTLGRVRRSADTIRHAAKDLMFDEDYRDRRQREQDPAKTYIGRSVEGEK